MVFTLVYVSSATRLLTRPQLEGLLIDCRERNTREAITGMLLYRDGNIMQLLEGDEADVRRVYAKISADPRHHGLIIIWTGYAATRQFPDWTMGFHDLNDAPVVHSGFTDVLDRPVTTQDFGHGSSLGQDLLAMFKKFG